MYDFFIFILKVAFVIIVFLSIVVGVIWPLYQNYRNRSQARSIESPVQYPRRIQPMFPLEEEELEIPSSENEGGDPKKKIIKMALDDPNKTTMLIRNWIKEKK